MTSTPNLITLNLGGLLNQLNDIEKGFEDLKSKFDKSQMQSKQEQASNSQQKNDESLKLTMLKSEMQRLTENFDNTKQTMNQMDELVLRIKENLDKSEITQKLQTEFNTDASQKLQNIQKQIQDQNQSLTNSLKALQRKDDFEIVKDELTEKVNGLESLRNQIQVQDDQLQELIDRVETIEKHGVQGTGNEGSTLESKLEGDLFKQRLLMSQDTPQTYSEEQKIIQAFIKQTIADSKLISKLQLFEFTLSHFTEIQNNKKNIDAQLAEAQDATEFTQHELQIQRSDSCAEVKDVNQIQDHLPSVISHIMDEHVKQVGDHVVYLEQIKPQWLNHFGQIQIGSDYAQVFAHVQVQTYQQEQLLSKQASDSLLLSELKNSVDDLRLSLKRESKRVDLLEEGTDIDLSYLTLDQAGLKELFKVMTDIKTDVLQKSASKDQIRELEREIADLKSFGITQASGNQGSTINSGLMSEIQETLAQIQSYPAQLQSLQMQIMKNETLCFDNSRFCHQLNRRIAEFEELNQINQAILDDFQNKKDLDQINKMNILTVLTSYIQTRSVSQTQFNEFSNDVLQGLAQIDVLKSQQQISLAKLADHNKHLRQIDSQFKALNQSTAQTKLMTERNNILLTEKVSFEIFNEETSYIKQLTSKPGKAVAGSSLTPQIVVQRPTGGASGGMTAQQKNQLKELVETMDRHENSIRNLQQGMRQLQLDELKQQISLIQKQVPMFAQKVYFERLQMEVASDILNQKTQSKIQQEETDKWLSKCDDRLTKVKQSQAENEEQLNKVLQTVSRIEEQIVSMKRGNAAGELRKKLMTQVINTALVTPQITNAEDEESPDFAQLKDEIEKIKNALTNRLDAQAKQLRLLLPLIEGPESEKKGGKKSDLETRITDRLLNLNSNQQEDIAKLKQTVEELKKAFDEKIRRQCLVIAQKQKPGDDFEFKKGVKKGTQFLARQIQRDLVINGKLPDLGNISENVVRYGKGFSQLPYSIEANLSPRLINDHSFGDLADSSNHQDYNAHLVSQPLLQDNYSYHTNSFQILQQTSSHPQINQRHLTHARESSQDNNKEQALQSQRLQAVPRAHILRVKKQSEVRPNANLTTLVMEDIGTSQYQSELPWEHAAYRLPIIHTSRSNHNKTIREMNETV